MFTKAGTVTAIKNTGQQIQGIGFPLLFSGIAYRNLIAHNQIGQFGFQQHFHLFGAFLLNFNPRLDRFYLKGFQAAKILFGQLKYSLWFYITDHHQNGIIGCIITLIPLAQIIDGHIFQIIHPADNRIMVAAAVKSGGIKLLISQSLGFIVSTHTTLFHHHHDFFFKLIFR